MVLAFLLAHLLVSCSAPVRRQPTALVAVRIVGGGTPTVLTAEEILSGARHADDIALATWPLELRETNRGPKLRYPENDAAAGIPLGCLIPADLERVFVAGRCISCDHGAQASIRVMGTCFATGEAAGSQAAAL